MNKKFKVVFEGNTYEIKKSSNLYNLYVNNVPIMGSIYPRNLVIKLKSIISKRIDNIYYEKS